ncbi:MAG TPA: hypothetical protein VGG10_16685 [Rhizomicrobium sp.]|jgi:filamentous hemagglutinin
MPTGQRWLFSAAALLIAVLFAIVAFQRQGTPDTTPLPPTPSASLRATQADGDVVWSHGRDGSERNAEEHWEKHGGEFPEYHSALDYEHGAQAFITHPPAGTLTKHDDRGDTLYYDPASNTFAVADRRGEPRTYFRPHNGMAYWERQ